MASGPIEIDLAPEHITPATIEDLQQEIAQHQELQNTALEKLMGHTNVPTKTNLKT